MAQSAKRLTLGFNSGRDLMVLWAQAPCWAMHWQCRAFLGFCLSLSLSLCPSPTHTLSVSLKINKLEKRQTEGQMIVKVMISKQEETSELLRLCRRLDGMTAKAKAPILSPLTSCVILNG